jgi:hypothetical protein
VHTERAKKGEKRQRTKRGKNVEQKKSIYGTAANDGKAGNKNQFITKHKSVRDGEK